jgi:predicted small secreted protein
MRRTLGPLATLVMLALIVAGCSNASAGAGSSGESTAATAGAAGSGTAHEKAVAFAECMRANGISAFPDPDASGELTIDGIANGSSVDTSSAAFKQAINACKDLEPPAFTGSKVTPQQRTARLEFAQCVRKNGVPDFPDPTPNGPLVDTNRIPSAATTSGMSILNAAMQKCGRYAAAAGVKGSQ